MRLGKTRCYFTKPKSELYSDKKVRVLLYEVIKYGKDNLVFTHKDIKRLLEEHLDNEAFNDKNMERIYSDFFLKLHNYKSLLRKIEEERKRQLKSNKEFFKGGNYEII